MAAIRHSLQQELFRPNDEALYSVVNVAKVGAGKKKKTSFLCAAGMLRKKITTEAKHERGVITEFLHMLFLAVDEVRAL